MPADILNGPDEAIGFVTATRRPVVVVPAGGQALQTNQDYIAKRLAEMYPDPVDQAMMAGWGRRWIPALDNPDAVIMAVNHEGVRTNAILRKEEWAELDRTVIMMVKLRRNVVADMQGAGLTKPGNLATTLSQWRAASERTRPTVSMDGRSRADRDRTDRKAYSVPVPIVRTDFGFGRRELLAARRAGDPLDTTEAAEAAESVAEEQERMVVEGESSVVVAGSTIYGLRNFSARDTDTATNYGGGDFGTESNGVKTVLGMLAALAAKRYHGPFTGYIHPTQYHELLTTHTDGSGQTELARIEMLPQIKAIKPTDFGTDGELVLVQWTVNIADLYVAVDLETREWESPDGQEYNFAVMSSMVARLKQDVAGNTGIAHATGC